MNRRKRRALKSEVRKQRLTPEQAQTTNVQFDEVVQKATAGKGKLNHFRGRGGGMR